MLADFKHRGKPVHIFEIGGVSYAVTRGTSFYGLFDQKHRIACVVAPDCMSYQQAALKAAQKITLLLNGRAGGIASSL